MDQKYWGEKAIELLRLWFGNAWNKAGLFLVAAGISTLVGWIEKFVRFALTVLFPSTPQSAWTDTPERIGWSLIALGLVVLGIGTYKRKPPNPNDVDLIVKFRRVFTAEQVEFLATHNFHHIWHNGFISNVEIVSDHWQGAQYEFLDKKLNALLVKVKGLSRKFVDLEDLGFFVRAGQPARTMKTNPDLNRLSTETQSRIDKLNSAARKLAKAVNELERTARRRLPNA
ncbi:hypothetical protein ACVWYQ_000764 [Bradyrhizobium sp. USDA 3397]